MLVLTFLANFSHIVCKRYTHLESVGSRMEILEEEEEEVEEEEEKEEEEGGGGRGRKGKRTF